MANEAVWLERPLGGTNPYQFTVAAGTSISKGTIMVLSSDPRTATASTTAAVVLTQVPLGILNADKDGADPSIRVGIDTEGIYDLTVVAGGPGSIIQIGEFVELSGANLIRGCQPRGVSGAEFISGGRYVLGYALETGSASEVIAVKLTV